MSIQPPSPSTYGTPTSSGSPSATSLPAGVLNVAASIATLGLIQSIRFSVVAVMCVLVYEWVANFEDERRLIHRAAFSSVKVTYLLCRYYPLCYWVVAVWAYCLDHNPMTCRKVLKPIHALLAPFQFFAQIVLLLRAYAFSGRNRWVLGILSVEYLLVVAANTHLFFVDVPVPRFSDFMLFIKLFGGTGCFPDYSTKAMGKRIGFAILASTLLDISSLIVVLWFCCKNHTGSTSLAKFFLRQGLAAFAFVGVVNIVSSVVYFRARGSVSGIGLPFALVMSNIIACRLILSLRRHTRQNDQARGSLTTFLWSSVGHRRTHHALTVDIWAVPTTRSNASLSQETSGDLHEAIPPEQRRPASTSTRINGYYCEFPRTDPNDSQEIRLELRTV